MTFFHQKAFTFSGIQADTEQQPYAVMLLIATINNSFNQDTVLSMIIPNCT